MHRTTWYAIPIVGLAVLSSGLGVWSYRLHADRQALVAQSDAQYSSAFHSLVSDMDKLTQRLGESEVTTDTSGFTLCQRDIWRMCFAAETELAKLPVELTPMHNTQTFLASLSNQSDTWLTEGASVQNSKVQKQVDSYYKKAKALDEQLVGVQGKVLHNGLGWVAVNRAINQKNGYHTGDNQIVDGFRTIEKHLTAFSETADLGGQIEGPKHQSMKLQGAPVTPSAAINKVASLLGTADTSRWKTKTSSLGGTAAVYMISGPTPHGNVSAVVSRAGGKVLTLHRDRNVANDRFGFAEAQSRAVSWLANQGFGKFVPEVSNESGNVGYFVLVPSTKFGLAVDSPVSMTVALDNGELLSLDTQAYYRTPVPASAPPRKYTSRTLKMKLNPQLAVEETRNVVVRTPAGQVKSGVQFIGTHGTETYSVILDAATGREISVTKLS